MKTKSFGPGILEALCLAQGTICFLLVVFSTFLKIMNLKKQSVVILIHLEKTSSLDSFNFVHTLDAKNYVLYTVPLFLMMY